MTGAPTGMFGRAPTPAGYATTGLRQRDDQTLPDSLLGPPRLPRVRQHSACRDAVQHALLFEPDFVHMDRIGLPTL